MVITSKSKLYEVVEHFAFELFKEPDGVQVYDFGVGITQAPMVDPNGSYLTTSICFLHTKGKGEVRTVGLNAHTEEIQNLGNGWKFVAVEIPYGGSPEDLIKKLVAAKKKLEDSNGNK